MRHGVYQITVEELSGLIACEDKPTIMRWAALTQPLVIGYANGEPLAVGGPVPTTLLSGQAYLWMLELSGIPGHKLAFAKMARDVVKKALGIYEELHGHCYGGRGDRWLKSIGAEFVGHQNGAAMFVIRRR